MMNKMLNTTNPGNCAFLAKKSSILQSVFFFLLFAVMLDAQPLGGENGTEKESASARSFACAIWEPLPFEVFYFDGIDYQPIELRPRQRSKNYDLPAGQSSFQLFREQTDEAGEIIYQLAGAASIPELAKVTLFMLSFAPEAEIPIRMFGIDDSVEAFPAGSFRFLNVSERVLLVRINGEKVEVGPREMKLASPEIPELSGFIPFYIADKANQKILYQTKLYAEPRGRSMAFIVIENDERGGDRVRIRFISDYAGAE
jgi:hypothetical protein